MAGTEKTEILMVSLCEFFFQFGVFFVVVLFFYVTFLTDLFQFLPYPL